MSSISRRDFMRKTAGAVASGAAIGGLGAFGENSPTLPEPIRATTIRSIGNTGLKTTLLGMGTGVRAWNGQSELTRKGRETFLNVLEHAYARGIRFFDLADMYGSHDYMKEAMKRSIKRDQVTILSKTVSKEPTAMRADIDRFRKELDTDYVDLVLLHCMTEPGWTQALKPCMDVLEEAKQKGVIKAHGVSCHNFDCMIEASKSPWVDVILARINPFKVKMDGEPEAIANVLRACHETGKGVLGMKIIGEGQLKDRVSESLKFVLGLGCVDALTIGFLDAREIDDAMDRIAAIEV